MNNFIPPPNMFGIPPLLVPLNVSNQVFTKKKDENGLQISELKELKISTNEMLKGKGSLFGTSPEDWEELLTEDGGKYYHNKVTKKTQWDKPKEFDEYQQLKNIECLWKEYKTKEGKKYYFNKTTNITQWTQPNEYKDYLERKEKIRQELAEKFNIKNNEDEIIKFQETSKIDSKEEAQNSFLQLLKESEIETDWDWNKAIKKIINDARYKVLESVSEKKELFNKYIQEKKETDREEKKREYKRS